MADALAVSELCVERAGRTILEGLSWRARYGEVSAILGPNGAGKSTLLRAALGLWPCRGSVHIDGIELARLTMTERAKRLSFVPQTTLLRSALPVRAVVGQGRYPHRGALTSLQADDHAIVEQAMRTADVADFADRSFTTLSFGEQRRVLIARGLATGARLLCLDEPTASLDVGHALALYELMRALAGEGKAIVVVLHQLDDAVQYTDRALLLSGGRAVAQGPTANVVSPEHIRRVYGVEMRSGEGVSFRLPG